jgi:hypothetical protein
VEPAKLTAEAYFDKEELGFPLLRDKNERNSSLPAETGTFVSTSLR